MLLFLPQTLLFYCIHYIFQRRPVWAMTFESIHAIFLNIRFRTGTVLEFTNNVLKINRYTSK